ATGAHVVGMALVGPGSEHDRRSPAPDDVDDLHLLVAAGAQSAIAEIELLAESGAEDFSGGERFAATRFGIAASSHLAARQIDDARALAVAHHLRDRPAARQLDVVGVCREEHCIDRTVFRHHRLTILNAAVSGSIS